MFVLHQSFGRELSHQISRHAQFLRRDVINLDLEQREQFGQRMHGAAKFQIADHRHGQAINLAQLFTNCKQIKQRLGRVFTDAITGVDDGLASVLCRRRRCTYLWVTQHDDIGVTL